MEENQTVSPAEQPTVSPVPSALADPVRSKFCKFCGEKIPEQAVICPKCGGQVEELKTSNSQTNFQQPQIVINNANANTNTNVNKNGTGGKACNKWVALLLCIFLGYFGAHKFYEGKAGLGILYIFTGGLCGIGWFIDIILILLKPRIYYV